MSGRRCANTADPDHTAKRTRQDALEDGLPHGITFTDRKHLSLGPLAWIEKGERRYARSRTEPIGPA